MPGSADAAAWPGAKPGAGIPGAGRSRVAVARLPDAKAGKGPALVRPPGAAVPAVPATCPRAARMAAAGFFPLMAAMMNWNCGPLPFN